MLRKILTCSDRLGFGLGKNIAPELYLEKVNLSQLQFHRARLCQLNAKDDDSELCLGKY